MTAITVNADITLIKEGNLTSTQDVVSFLQAKYPEFTVSWRVSCDPGGPTMTVIIHAGR